MRSGGAAHKNQKRRRILIALRAVVISSEVEKSFSFTIRRIMFVNPKRETCYPQDLRASPHIIFAAKPPPSFLIPNSSFLIRAERSSPIKEQHAHGLPPELIILSTNDSIYDNIVEYIHDGVVRARRRERSKKNIR